SRLLRCNQEPATFPLHVITVFFLIQVFAHGRIVHEAGRIFLGDGGIVRHNRENANLSKYVRHARLTA
ncbi:MAG: hypothetical protein L0J71_03170, partial [Bifidobacterium crudilactis]|nr:hypothetical protein [Bifidobacterium crudilactis]